MDARWFRLGDHGRYVAYPGSSTMSKILLNDILNLPDLRNVKIRFNLMVGGNWNPIELFTGDGIDSLLRGHYWNYKNRRSYKVGQTTIGFVKLSSDDLWLLFHVGLVTKDLGKFNAVGYEFENIPVFQKYCGRLIVRFKNRSQTMIRRAASVIDDCEIEKILPAVFDNDLFPGYDQVNISWTMLKNVLRNDGWKTALHNQKGVYLLTDTSNGKMYVGSAYGENMILGRWKSYVRTGHGGNAGLRTLDFDHIKKYFRFSILDIFKSSTDDRAIIEREQWWKSVLQTREFGYNLN